MQVSYVPGVNAIIPDPVYDNLLVENVTEDSTKTNLKVDSKAVSECLCPDTHMHRRTVTHTHAQMDGQRENIMPPSHLLDEQRHKS